MLWLDQTMQRVLVEYQAVLSAGAEITWSPASKREEFDQRLNEALDMDRQRAAALEEVAAL